MTRRGLIRACVLLLALGIALQLGVRYAAGELDERLRPGQHIALDVARLRDKLDELRAEERPEQLADWAFYGTAIYAGLSAEELRDATYDRTPFRDPALVDVVHFDYGPGRRLILSDGAVWLFYATGDPDRILTLAHLADQVRTELGGLPAAFRVFNYRSDLARGAIDVTREPDLAAEKLFSAEYGYKEMLVQSTAALTLFLSEVQDVTHARLVPEGGVVLGGRRRPDAQPQISLVPIEGGALAMVEDGAVASRVKLADVAALYQAAVQSATAPGFSLEPRTGPFGQRSYCAHYSGPLQGTAVGLNLFYTDLGAKLWAGLALDIDAARDEVVGLTALPLVGPEIGPQFWRELGRYPRARIWFAPHPAGFAATADDGELDFAPIATQVYAAGLDSEAPAHEAAPVEDARRVVRFWDHNYAAIAAYEPQYQVLNQIMKWSILVRWLAKQSQLADLGKEGVDRSLSFGDWYAASTDLRLRRALPLHGEDGEECLDALRSAPYEAAGRKLVIEGGIRLAGALDLEEPLLGGELNKVFLTEPPAPTSPTHSGLRPSLRLTLRTSFRAPAVPRKNGEPSLVRPPLRQLTATRPGVNFRLAGIARGKTVETGPGQVKVTTSTGTTYELTASSRGAARAEVRLAERLPPLPGARNLRITALSTAYLVRDKACLIRASQEQTSLGGLHAERTSQGVQLRWQEGDSRVNRSGGGGRLAPGESRAALLEMHVAAQRGPVGQAAVNLQRSSPVATLRRGQVSAAARIFASAPAGTDPRRLMLQGLQQQDAQRYVAARAGLTPGLPRETAQEIRLVRSGYALHTALPLRAGGRQTLSPQAAQDAVRGLRQQGGEVYVEEGALLGTYDWDGRPGKSLSQAVQDRRFVFMRLDDTKLGTFRPGKLVEEQGPSYVRRHVPTEWTTADASGYRYNWQRTATRSRERVPSYLVRACEDRNRDGQLDPEELQLCHDCDRDQDGHVDDRELRDCSRSG